jgi:hypothetical protein
MNSTPSTSAAGEVRERRRPATRSRRVDLLAERAQGSHAVERDRRGRGAAELIVENLERNRTAVSRVRDRAEIIADRIVSLTRIAPIVPAERQRVHHQSRCVGDLHQRDLLHRNRAHRRDRIAADAGVKTVEHDAQIGPIGRPHDIPGRGPVPDMATPGQRLVADIETVLTRAIRELAEVGGRARGIVGRFVRDVGADAQQRRPEFVHQLELALGALEIARADRSRHRLEIAHRLQRDDLETELVGHRAGVARLAAEEGQIVLEDFDGAKAGLGRRGELGLQGAAHADRRDRPSEHFKNLLDFSMP